MGLFGSRGVSKKPVKQWNPDRVNRWLVSIGKQAYSPKFRGVTGQRLLKLSERDIYELTNTKLEGDVIIDSIAELKARDGIPDIEPPENDENVKADENVEPQNVPQTKQQSSPQMFVKTSSRIEPSLSSANQSPAHPATDPGRAETDTQSGKTDTQSATPISNSITPSATPSANIQRGTAAALAELVGDEDVVAGLYEYLSLLGIQGMGLVEATERSQPVGHVIGAVWELHDLVSEAKGNRPNCMQLNLYCQDILRVFDAEGKRLAFLEPSSLDLVLQLIEAGIGIVQSNCQPGWLLRMAINDKSVEEFQAIHNAILDVLRKEKVDTLPNGRQLTYGDYRDASRPLKRLLKQLGSGSLENGVAFVLEHEDAQTSLAQLLGIDKQLVVKDLAHKEAQQEMDLMATMVSTQIGIADNSDLPAGRDREFHTIFAQYDKNGSGALEYEELRSVLADLGLLDSIKPTDIEPYTRQQFELADADGDGSVGFEEFTLFYQALTTSKARRELRAIMGPHAEKELKKIFSSFVSFGVRQQVDEMDGARFSKLCRDCKLLNKDFTTTDVDLVFAKIKAKGQRRITFEGFLASLLEIAVKKRQLLEDVVEQVLSAGGPTVTATKADYVKFHDDKSTYTGVYSRGGPTNVEPSKDLSALLDRSEADVRGLKKRSSHNRNSSAASSGHSSRRESFLGESASYDGWRRESTNGSVDGGQPRVSSSGGEPSYAGSNLGSVRHASGGLPPAGPSTGARASLATPPSASPLARAGVEAQRSSPSSVRSECGSDALSASPRPLTEGTSHIPELTQQRSAQQLAHLAPSKDLGGASPSPSREELKNVFLAYVSFGRRASHDGTAEMDGAKFAKLCRECHLLNSTFNSTSADIIFSKVKAKGARKIDFKAFRKAIVEMAKAKSVDTATIERQIVSSGGPQMSSTTPSHHVRLHDDKTTYTGVYKAGGPSVIDKHITLENLTDRSVSSNRTRMAI